MNALKKISLATLFGATFALAPTIVNAQDGVRYLGPAVSVVPSATFQLTSDHCTPVGATDGSGGCGLAGGTQSVFGTIVVTDLGGGTLAFHVTLDNGNKFVNTGFPLTFAFNLAASSITYSGLTAGWQIPVCCTPPGPGPVTFANPQVAGNFHQDGTGFFDFGVLWGTQGGGKGTAGPLDFDINATGLTLASLEKNGNGQFFAVDILSGTTGATGNVDASSVFSCTGPQCGDIPEPASLALLAIGLFALYAVGRRRRR